MKILLAIKSLNVPGGGAERVFVDVANGLARRGHAVEALTFDYPGEVFYPLDRRIPRHDMAFNPPGVPLPRIGYIKAIPRIRKAACSVNPDVIVAFMHSTYVPLTLALTRTGLPLIASEHTDARHYANRPFQQFLRRQIDRRAVARTFPSHTTLLSYGDNISQRTLVLPNPVDLEAFLPSSATAPTQPLTVLCVGRLMKEKDHATLLQAFAKVAPDFPDWRLKIVGDGHLRPELEAEIGRLALGERVELPGYTRNIVREYADAAIVAISSRYKSFGLAAAEALAAGRPVVAFDDCTGVAEMVRNGVNGILVPGAKDSELRVAGLAGGLHSLMANATLRNRLGAAGPEAVKPYGIEAVLDCWEELLEQIGPIRGPAGSAVGVQPGSQS